MQIKRKCDWCGELYLAETRDLDRGWGRCCRKSHASSVKSFGKNYFDDSYKIGPKKKRYYEPKTDFDNGQDPLFYDDQDQDVFSDMNV